MRVKAATVQKCLLGLALLAALAWNLAHASEVKGVELSVGATGTRAEIALLGAGQFNVISLNGPDRLVVDLPASTLARGLRLPGRAGVVKSVRTGEPVAGTSRIVFDLSQPVMVLKPRIEQGGNGPRLVLEWPGDGTEGSITAALPPAAISSVSSAAPSTAPAVAPGEVSTASSEATTRLISAMVAEHNNASAAVTMPTPTAAIANNSVPAPVSPSPSSSMPPAATVASHGEPSRLSTGLPGLVPGVPAALGNTPSASVAAPASNQQAPVKTMKDVMRGRGMRPLIVAIDAGHGGQDPGALGPSGKREKDVTLALARELARQVGATPGLKAFLVRDTDVFVPLPQRAQLARQARADIFISIHADAAENRSARGSSVYVLSLKGASSQRARWLADKENASDLIGGVRLEQTSDTLASVLIDLTQSGHMRASEDVAGQVLDGLKRVGANHKPQIERANFAVLRTSDMPAMLVETGFISNWEEERLLTDPAHQRNVARAVLDGVNAYFTRQPPPGTLYSARAEAGYAGVDAGAGGGSP